MRFIILTVLLFCYAYADAQVDTSFSFSRKGIQEEFYLKKYEKSSQIRKYPVYGIEKAEIQDIQKLLTLFVGEETDLKLLKDNNQQMVSLYESKIAVYENNQKIQEARIKNYDSAYNEMKKINGQLNDQLKNCEDLAIKENKRTKRPSILGILGGLAAGIVVGIIIQ